MAENLILSLWIRAHDQASSILRMVGLGGNAAFGMLTVGAAGVAGAIAAVGIASTVMATHFDQSMHKIAALTDTSSQQLDWYKQQILALSPAIDVSAKDLADGLYFVISAGFKGQQAMDILKYSAEAAAAGMTDMKGVTDAVTSAMNAYRGAGYTAGQVTDMLTTAVVNGKMEWSNLVTSFGFTATTARTAGLSLQEVTSAVSTLTQVAGSHGARRIQMELDNLMRSMGDTGRIQKTAQSLGLAFDPAKFAASDFMGKLRQLMQISGFSQQSLEALRAKAHGNEQVFEQLALQAANNNTNFRKLVGGAAAFIPAAILLSDNGQRYNEILKQMSGNGEKTADAFQKMRESTGQQWRMFLLSLQSIAITIGLQILPAVNKLLGFLTPLMRQITAWLATKEGMQQFKMALAGIAAVAGGVLLAALIAAAIAGAPLVTILGIIIGVIAAGSALGVGIGKLVQAFGGWQNIMKNLQPLITAIQNGLKAAGKEIQQAFANPQIKQALQQLGQAFVQLKPLFILIGAILLGVIIVAFHLLVAIITGLAGALPGLITFFSGLLNILGGIGRFILDLFTNQKDIPNALRQIAQGILQVGQGLLGSILGLLGGFFGHFLGLFGKNWADVGHGFQDLWKHITDGVGGFFSGLGTKLHDWIEGQKRIFQNGISTLGTIVHGALENVKNAFLAPFRFIANLFPWLYHHNYYVQRLVDTIREKITMARVFLAAAVLIIRARLQQAWQFIQNEARQAWAWVYQHIVQPVQQVYQKVQTILTQVRTWILARWNDIKTDAQQAWDHFVGLIGNLKDQITTKVHDAVIQPILDKWEGLKKTLANAGSDLMKMIGDSMKNGAHFISDAAKNALGGIAKFLGFHSPAPAVPESAYWGANLVKMFANSMGTQLPVATQAAQRIVAGIHRSLAGVGSAAGGAGAGFGGLGSGGTGGIGRAAGGAAAALAHLGGSGKQVVHNWAGAFPNAVNTEQIVAAIRQVQRDDYRAARRPGGLQGVRAGT